MKTTYQIKSQTGDAMSIAPCFWPGNANCNTPITKNYTYERQSNGPN